MFKGDIPNEWQFNQESDTELSSEGDWLAFEREVEDGTLECTVQAVKEKSHRLDFLGQIVLLADDGSEEELESLWLASDDFPTVSHTREEILDWAIGMMESYEDY